MPVTTRTQLWKVALLPLRAVGAVLVEDEGVYLAVLVAFEFEGGGDDVVFEVAGLGFEDGHGGLPGELGEEGAGLHAHGEGGEGAQGILAFVGFQFVPGREEDDGRCGVGSRPFWWRTREATLSSSRANWSSAATSW